MESIAVDHVTQIYHDDRGRMFTVLKNIQLTWEKGESLALMGESGSGKSTLARLLIGLEPPSSGCILLDGEDTTHWRFGEWRKHRSRLQAVFQDASGTLNPKRSVYRNMEEALLNLTDQTSAQRRETLRELMDYIGLDRALLKTPVRCLSGGEQRRISLLRALAVRPDYLVLDEVTNGLDLISTDAVLSTLEAYRGKFGCSYLFITHDWNLASRLAKRVLVIESGELQKEAVHNINQGKKVLNNET